MSAVPRILGVQMVMGVTAVTSSLHHLASLLPEEKTLVCLLMRRFCLSSTAKSSLEQWVPAHSGGSVLTSSSSSLPPLAVHYSRNQSRGVAAVSEAECFNLGRRLSAPFKAKSFRPLLPPSFSPPLFSLEAMWPVNLPALFGDRRKVRKHACVRTHGTRS